MKHATTTRTRLKLISFKDTTMTHYELKTNNVNESPVMLTRVSPANVPHLYVGEKLKAKRDERTLSVLALDADGFTYRYDAYVIPKRKNTYLYFQGMWFRVDPDDVDALNAKRFGRVVRVHPDGYQELVRVE